MTTSQGRERQFFFIRKGGGVSWYFIETERFQEEQVKEALLNSQFDVFVPKKEMYFKKGDLTTLTLRFLFPGTVLIHDPASPPQFA